MLTGWQMAAGHRGLKYQLVVQTTKLNLNYLKLP